MQQSCRIRQFDFYGDGRLFIIQENGILAWMKGMEGISNRGKGFLTPMDRMGRILDWGMGSGGWGFYGCRPI